MDTSNQNESVHKGLGHPQMNYVVFQNVVSECPSGTQFEWPI